MSALAMLACSDVNFDGLYVVDSYTFNEASCAEPGPEVEREFGKFRIKERSFFGVDIYPVYPCDDDGVCATDNHEVWGLVTVEDDLDQVSYTMAGNFGDGCLLSSMEMVIEGVEDTVVLQQRTNVLLVEPYDAPACTADRAKSMRSKMECAQLLQLVGVPDLAESM